MGAWILFGIVLLIMGLWGLTWPGIRSVIGYRKALKTYGVVPIS